VNNLSDIHTGATVREYTHHSDTSWFRANQSWHLLLKT